MTELNPEPDSQPLEALAMEIDPMAVEVAKRFVEMCEKTAMTKEEKITLLAGDIAAITLMTYGQAVSEMKDKKEK